MDGKRHRRDGLMVQFQLSQPFLILSFNFGVAYPIEHKLNHAYILGNLCFPHFWYFHVHDILDVDYFDDRVEFEQTFN
jgi:hypothetical protein